MSIKATLLIVVIGLVVVFTSWYLSSLFVKNPSNNYDSQPSLSDASDTTQNISEDLNRVPEDTVVSGEIDYLDKDIEGF